MMRAMAGNTPTLSGTSSSIGGILLNAGFAIVTTINIPGARVGMPVSVSPTNPDVAAAYPYDAFVSSDNIVTVIVRSIVLGVPPVSSYNVKVIQ